jgi:hypothetical protein
MYVLIHSSLCVLNFILPKLPAPYKRLSRHFLMYGSCGGCTALCVCVSFVTFTAK